VSDDLVAFLSARLDEAQGRAEAMRHLAACDDYCTCGLRERRALALREVKAKRTLMTWFTDAETGNPMTAAVASTARDIALGNWIPVPAGWVQRELAAIWSDHPEYRREWAW
jgi:hypothetical protein